MGIPPRNAAVPQQQALAPPAPPTPDTPVPASEAVGNTKAAKKSRAKVAALTPNEVAERALSDQLKAELLAKGEPLPGAAAGGTETTPPRLANRVPESEVIDDVVNGRLKVRKTNSKSPIVVQEQQAAARKANPTPETQAAAVQKKLDSDGIPAAKRTARKIAAVQKSLFGDEPTADVPKTTKGLKAEIAKKASKALFPLNFYSDVSNTVRHGIPEGDIYEKNDRGSYKPSADPGVNWLQRMFQMRSGSAGTQRSLRDFGA